jgi:hypothetical protein
MIATLSQRLVFLARSVRLEIDHFVPISPMNGRQAREVVAFFASLSKT